MAGGLRILFIDDDASLLNALGTALRSSRDWQIELALGGEEGLEALERAPYDVVVTDLDMPIVGGRAILDAARSVQPQALRIVLTGADVGKEQLDADAVIIKPCSIGRLRRIIEATRTESWRS
ncbi:MAG: response regulator [Kofleriaceae bacterium]|nr:response regulator [Kofleriaceae bacterium]